MRGTQFTVTRDDVHVRTSYLLQRHLKLNDFSAKCTATTLLTILLAAAARVVSIFAIARHLLHAPSDETLRQALLTTLPDYSELQRRLNRALAGDLPRALRRHRQPIAIDLTLIPYHGQPYQEISEIYRSKPKSGTSNFHGYATSYVIRKGQRFTVALTPVKRGERMEEVIKRLLRQTAQAGVRPRYLLLDSGFYSVGVVRYLQAARYPFLMPTAFRGRRSKKHASGPAFRNWKRSGWSSHTWRNKDGKTATVSIAVVCRNYRGQRGRHGRRRLIYAFWGLQPTSSTWVYETYRRRFAIETTYRQMNEARIRTTTRNPLIRLFYAGLALLLRNVWVWMHYQVLAERRRGNRRVALERLRFQTLLAWLLHVAEAAFGLNDRLQSEVPIPLAA
jgi:Transposase DDE domain